MKIAHTYSIIALSDDLSEIGVAVQSHWFAVGAVCPWVVPGVGAIATQSMVEISYGPKGMALLRSGVNTAQALASLISEDEGRDLRQVAMISANGNVATHTGTRCIAEAGHQIGKNYSVQANMMLLNTVWPSMAQAFENASGNLAERLFAALLAAENQGGDIRGKQSAAIMVAENVLDDSPWKHFTTNLRVDDHSDPIAEIRRLMDLEKAYALMNAWDELMSDREVEKANKKYTQAAMLAPGNDELPFWQAVTLSETGNLDQALPIFKRIFSNNPDWARLIQRLPASGLLPDDPDLLRTILSVVNEED
jgi:uncharacterized Ntn-hydrolase superfamily protein